MADTKISDLTEDTAPDASADFLVTVDTSAGNNKKVKPQNLRTFHWQTVAASDETTALTTGTGKTTFRWGCAFNLTEVRASLTTAQASGSIFTVNVKKNGTTIFSTNLTIDNTEKTSVTAATAAVISTASISDDDEISIDITQIGDGTAKGLKVTFLGYRV